MIIIESSPFVRCLQTAVCIAKELGVEEVRVNYLYCEWLKGKFFPDGCPLEDLIIRNTPREQFVKEYNFQGVKFDDNDHGYEEARQFYPETWNDQFDRSKYMVREFKQNYRKEYSRIAHLVISHGALVNGFARTCQSGNYNLQIPQLTPYCGIAAITISGYRFKLVFSADNVHLRKLEKKLRRDKEKQKQQHKNEKLLISVNKD